MIRVLLLSLSAVVLSGQMGPGNIVPGRQFLLTVSPVLRQYLDLTQEQVMRIDRLNNAFLQFQSEKARRMAQVQFEISQETTRPSLDAMALGLRYVEMEAIRRETEAEQKKTAEAVQAVLTPAQRTKVGVLQEALRMQSVACDALRVNLMSAPAVELPNGSMGVASFLLGGVINGGCPAIPTGMIRIGDFTTTPLQP